MPSCRHHAASATTSVLFLLNRRYIPLPSTTDFKFSHILLLILKHWSEGQRHRDVDWCLNHLGHSPNTFNIQSQARPKLEVWNSIQVSHERVRIQVFEPLPASFWGALAGNELEAELGLKSRHHHAGCTHPMQSLNCYAKCLCWFQYLVIDWDPWSQECYIKYDYIAYVVYNYLWSYRNYNIPLFLNEYTFFWLKWHLLIYS